MRVDEFLEVEVVVKRKKKKQQATGAMSASTQKISKMIWAFAGDFIKSGDTLEEKQQRLNAACSAWNIACNPPDVHKRSLNQYVESYKSYNPDVGDQEASAVRSDMERLIQSKLSLFPSVNKQIVGAQITQMAGKDRIDAASATLK